MLLRTRRCVFARTWWFVAAVLVTVLAAARGRAQALQGPLTDSEEISIDAAEIAYDKKTDIVFARGHVVVVRGSTELRADEVRFNRTTNEADARGNVILTDREGTIFAEAMHLNFDEETGILEGAEVQLPRNQYSLWGDKIEKGLGMSFRIENGKFTTCQCEQGPPSWSISADDLAVSLGGYGNLRSGTFNILDVPVLYLPRAFFPVQVERQSGFLIPQFGVSSRRGFQMLLPFYWAIDKSQDATLALDVETNARLGFVGEYRYMFGGGVRGILEASYFNDLFLGEQQGPTFDPNIGENRWSVVGQHWQPAWEGAAAFAEAFIVSDDLFLRDINTYAFSYSVGTAIRTLPYTKSRAGLLQQWDAAAVKLEGVYYQDLTGPESSVPQRAPQLDAWGQTILGSYLIGDVGASGVNFAREDDVTGLRLDLEPSVTLPFPLAPYAFGGVRAAARETAYFLQDTTISGSLAPGAPAELPADQSRELVEVRAALGTELNRVYAFDWLGVEKVRHSIEPTLQYLYVPAVTQEDLPLFDGVDRINQRNLFTYGAVTRLVGKFALGGSDEPGTDVRRTGSVASEYREIGRLSVMQSVDPSREINPLQGDRPADHFSDIDVAGSINPARTFSLRFATNYDTSNTNVSATAVGFFINEPWNPYRDEDSRLQTRTSAGVAYRFITGNQLQEINANAVVRLTDWAGIFYASRYDVVQHQFLDSYYGLRLSSTCDCWALDVAVEDRTNPSEVLVRAQLTLVGFGSGGRPSRVAWMP